jgi:DNA-binding GntR family transcriptional regulator
MAEDEMSHDAIPPYRTKTAVAVDSIRALVTGGELRPGESFTYRRLAERLGMSQTPIREAVRQLESEGLLRSEPHKGVTVTGLADLSIEEAQDIYLVRMLLEREASRLAASNITATQARELTATRADMEAAATAGDGVRVSRLHAQWHFQIHRASGSPYLATLCASAWHRFPWEAVWVVPGRLDRAMDQHRDIEEAVLAGDVDAASALMANHIASGRDTVLSHLRFDLKPDRDRL